MRFWAMALDRVWVTCSWPTTSAKRCGRYLRAMTWYDMSPEIKGMPGRPRRTQSKLPLLHSCPGGVRKSAFHGPWQILGHDKAGRARRQELFGPAWDKT